MKTIEKIESRGYKVTAFMSGNGYQATKANQRITAENITKLYEKTK